MIIAIRADTVFGVSDTKPIPVRLDHDLIARLDRAAERLGNTRAGVIKLCLTAFLDHFEAVGVASLPLNWKEIVQYWDRRTRRSHGQEPRPSAFPDSKEEAHLLNESASPPAPAIASIPPSRKPPEDTVESAARSVGRKRK